ncbi:MAG: HAD-IA family hydrolase [Bacteroidota bacterium]
MALAAVLLDLDGTLTDTTGLHAVSWAEALAKHGYRMPASRIEREIGRTSPMLLQTLFGDAFSDDERDALLANHRARFAKLLKASDNVLFEGVPKLFAALRTRGLKIAIATSAHRQGVERTVAATGFDVYAEADVVVHGEEVTRSKPAPDLVLEAAKRLDVSPAACAMVGDTPYDMAAARRAGVVPIAVATGAYTAADFFAEGARAVHDNVADLLGDLDAVLTTASPSPHVLSHVLLDMLMAEALDEARRGEADGEVPIGAVLARYDGTILARGHNEAKQRQNRIAHAETVCLEHAAGQTDGDDLILVTTMEPCTMCLGAAMNAGIDTIVYAIEAPPNGGLERCKPYAATEGVFPRAVGGVGRAESLEMLRDYAEARPQTRFVTRLLRSLDQ